MLPEYLCFRKISYDDAPRDRDGLVRVNNLHDCDRDHDDRFHALRVRDDYIHDLIFFNLYESHSNLSFFVPILHLIYWEEEILILFIQNPSYFYYFQKFLLLIDSFHQGNYNCKLLQLNVILFIMFFLHVNANYWIYHGIPNANDHDRGNDRENDRNDHPLMSEEFS
mgnify:CR=1 FL=1